MDEDQDLELEFRLTWFGAGGGKTGAVRQTLNGVKKEWLRQVARKSRDLELQVREVPQWNEAMDLADAVNLLGVPMPVPDWNSMSEETQHNMAWGRSCQFPGLDPESTEGSAFRELCRAEMAAGRDLPTWSPS